MPDRERTDAGTYVETVTLDAVRDVFDDVRGPVVTSSDVADALDCTTEAARQKLTRLFDRGEVDKRKTGRTVVYWRVGDVDQDGARDGREDAESAPGDRADRSDLSTPDATSTADDDALADALAGWRHGRWEEEQSASETVALTSLNWLRETPLADVRKSDVPLDDIADADPEDRKPETLWTEVILDAWQHAAERGYVEQLNSRAYSWTGMTGDDATGEGDDA